MSTKSSTTDNDKDEGDETVQEALQALVAKGLVEFVGTYRNGRPVYRITLKGMSMSSKKRH